MHDALRPSDGRGVVIPSDARDLQFAGSCRKTAERRASAALISTCLGRFSRWCRASVAFWSAPAHGSSPRRRWVILARWHSLGFLLEAAYRHSSTPERQKRALRGTPKSCPSTNLALQQPEKRSPRGKRNIADRIHWPKRKRRFSAAWETAYPWGETTLVLGVVFSLKASSEIFWFTLTSEYFARR